MRPAFSSTKQAATFGLLLIAVVLSPVLAGKRFLPPREQSYAVQGWDNGPYPWLHQQIFEETNTIDIAFVGSSLMMWGIDTSYVQAKLSEKLGHPTVVRSICWGGTGYDALYFVAQDLLAHRKVRMLVFYDEDVVLRKYRNTQASLWFRYGDNAEALSGLSMSEKALLYFSAMIGLPRNLLSLLSPVEPLPVISSKPNSMESYFHTLNPGARLGSVASELECTPAADALSFEPFKPSNGVNPTDVCVYSPTNSNRFQFLNGPLPAWQEHFARKFAALTEQHGCKLVLLNLPLLDTNRPAIIEERIFWPDLMKADLTMAGIPQAKFFEGLSDSEIYHLYYNAGHRNNAYNSHLNRNGQEYFTGLLTPKLIGLFEAINNP